MVNSREDFHLQDFAHAGCTNGPLAVATLSIPALKGEVFREFSINGYQQERSQKMLQSRIPLS